MDHDTQHADISTNAPDSKPEGRRTRLIAMIDRRAAAMTETHARERIASLAVLSVLQVAFALLVLSHAPEGVKALSSVGFVLSLCLIFNAALVLVCRRRIETSALPFPS